MPKKKPQGRPPGSIRVKPENAIKPRTFNISDKDDAKINKLRGSKARGQWLVTTHQDLQDS